MKIKYMYLYASLLATTLGVSSCGSSNDDNNPIEKPAELALDKDTIKVGVEETAELNVKEGAGSYKVFSENPTIATTEIADKKITIKGQDKGYTAVVVSDENGAYKRIPVQSMYKHMAADSTNLRINMKLGNTQNVTITLTAGNGNYKAQIDNSNIAKIASIDGNKVTITALTEGSANLIITDMMNLSLTIPITAKTTTVPYTSEELQVLKNDNTLHYTFNGNSVYNESDSWYNYINQMDGDYNMYGFDYYGYMYFKVWFEGDKTVGKKSPAKIEAKITWNDNASSSDALTFEIVKNDGTFIWAVYSFIQDNKLYYGNFCQKISADQ